MARRGDGQGAVITDARRSRTEDIDRRQRRYAISMAIRTACFAAMFFVPGAWRILCVAGAAIIPGVAVVLANARDNRSAPADLADQEPAPMETLALTSGHVIKGEVEHPVG